MRKGTLVASIGNTMPISAKKQIKQEYQKFDPLKSAGLSLRYLTSMTDPALDHLPYWLVEPYQNPPFSEHCRVDDTELTASWYEGISCAREMLDNIPDGADVEADLRKHILNPDAWGQNGLRFGLKRSWTTLEYCTFFEMAHVLSALNRMIEVDSKDKEAEDRASALVKGLRKLVTEHTIRTTWTGAVALDEKDYEFITDTCLKKEGMDPAVTTGFGDIALRNATLVMPLVNRYQLTEDKTALDLAIGLSNHILSIAHQFNFRMEFFGHVHSAMWFAGGLVKLGRITQQDRYIAKGKAIYDYVRRSSSAFGWVPEYMAWRLLADERCETCCIKDMIICGLELVDAGFPEYWDDVHRFWRNQLIENQIIDTNFIAGGGGPADTDIRTYHNMKDRVKGAYTGGSLPNGIQLGSFKNVAGCCSASAPVAMLMAWRATCEFHRGILTVNFPVSFDCAQATVDVGYPNDGIIRITVKKACRVILRIFPWQPVPHEGTVNGRPAALERRDDLLFFPVVEKGSILEFKHELKLRRVMEHVAGNDFFGIWKGPDMVDILPHSTSFRTYQRTVGEPIESPPPPPDATDGLIQYELEPIPMRETRINRRKAPRP